MNIHTITLKKYSIPLIAVILISLFAVSMFTFLGNNTQTDTDYLPHANKYLTDKERDSIPLYVQRNGLGGQYLSSGGQTFDEGGNYSDPYLRLFVKQNSTQQWYNFTDPSDLSQIPLNDIEILWVRSPYGLYGIYCNPHTKWGQMELVTSPYRFSTEENLAPLNGLFIRQWVRKDTTDYSKWLTTRTVQNKTGNYIDPRTAIYVKCISAEQWVFGYNISEVMWFQDDYTPQNLFSYNISVTVNYNSRFAKIGIDSKFGRSIDGIGYEFVLACNPAYIYDDYGSDSVVVTNNLILKRYKLDDIADCISTIPNWIQVADIYDRAGRLRHRFDFRDFEKYGLDQQLLYQVQETNDLEHFPTGINQYIVRVRGARTVNLDAGIWVNFDPSLTTSNAETNSRTTRFGGDFSSIVSSLLADSSSITSFVATGNNGTYNDMTDAITTEGWQAHYGTVIIDTDDDATDFDGTFYQMTDTVGDKLTMEANSESNLEGSTATPTSDTWGGQTMKQKFYLNAGEKVSRLYVYVHGDTDASNQPGYIKNDAETETYATFTMYWHDWGADGWYQCQDFTDWMVPESGYYRLVCAVPYAGSVNFKKYTVNQYGGTNEAYYGGAWHDVDFGCQLKGYTYKTTGYYISSSIDGGTTHNWMSMNINSTLGGADIDLYVDSDADDADWSYTWTKVADLTGGSETGIDISSESEQFLRYKVTVVSGGSGLLQVDDIDVLINKATSGTTSSGYFSNAYNLTIYEDADNTQYMYVNKTYDIGSCGTYRNQMWIGFALYSGNLTDDFYVEYVFYDSSNSTLGTVRYYLASSSYSDESGIDVVYIRASPSVDTWYFFVDQLTNQLTDSGGATLSLTGEGAVDDIQFVKITFYVNSTQTHASDESFFIDSWFFGLFESYIDLINPVIVDDAKTEYNVTSSGLLIYDETPAADSMFNCTTDSLGTFTWDTNKIYYLDVDFDSGAAFGIEFNATDDSKGWIYFNYDDFDTLNATGYSNSSSTYYFDVFPNTGTAQTLNVTYAIETAQANAWMSGKTIDSMTDFFFGETSSGSDDYIVVGNFTFFDVDASQPPTITLNSPSEGSTLNVSNTIDLSVTDSGSGVAYVGYRWGGSGSYVTLSSPYDITITLTMYSTNLTSGSNTLYVWANDTAGNSGIDTFDFNVDKGGPTISSPDDVTYTEGDQGITITWTITDDNANKYNVTRDGTVVKSGSYTSGSSIVVNIGGLSVGSYTYTMYANNTNGISSSDSVGVTVNAMGGGTVGGGGGFSEKQVLNIDVDYAKNITQYDNQKISVTLTDERGGYVSGARVYIDFEGARYTVPEVTTSRIYDRITINELAPASTYTTQKGVYEVEIETESLEQGTYNFDLSVFALGFKDAHQTHSFDIGGVLAAPILEVGEIRISDVTVRGSILLIFGGILGVVLYLKTNKKTRRAIRRTKDKVSWKHQKFMDRNRRRQ